MPMRGAEPHRDRWLPGNLQRIAAAFALGAIDLAQVITQFPLALGLAQYRLLLCLPRAEFDALLAGCLPFNHFLVAHLNRSLGRCYGRKFQQ